MQVEDTPSKSGYERWIEGEGVPIIEGYAVEEMAAVPRRPWPRLGGSGCYIQLKGMEGVTGMYVAEIPPSGALNPERHLYEELVYVLKGRGLTQVWQAGEGKRAFEWGEGSLFALPLNTWHQLINGGREPVLLMAVTTAPLIMDLFRNPDFVLNTDYQFKERYSGQEGYFNVSDKRYRRGRSNVWETNFIPDVRTAWLDESAGLKVWGGRNNYFEIADNSLIGHISDWPEGTYHKAHYHGAGAIVLTLRSTGYSLLWPSQIGTRPYQAGREDAVVKVDWKPGTAISPPSGWFHQHFNTGREPTRQLAIRLGSRRNPILFKVAAARVWDGAVKTLEEGGTLIEHENEDPEIRRRWEQALKREGIESRMPPVVYR